MLTIKNTSYPIFVESTDSIYYQFMFQESLSRTADQSKPRTFLLKHNINISDVTRRLLGLLK